MNMKTPKSLLPDNGEEEEGIIMNAQNVDFSEYEWMGEEEIEEFDRKVEEEFWEEAFMEACFTEMLEEEESQWRYFISNTDLQGEDKFLAQGLVYSKLNPDAPVFIPGDKYKGHI